MPTKRKSPNREVKRLQDNLLFIRRIGGWTLEKFGEKIGLSKQTLSNVETGKTPMNITHYVTIRVILDYEMTLNNHKTILPAVTHILLDKASSETEYHAARKKIATLSAISLTDITDASLTALFISAFGEEMASNALGTQTAWPSAAAMPFWVHKIMKENDADKEHIHH